eukprot:CAMPEP_0170553306 /NCGR_PEP_ID=MMETSP0211-20121228/11117_1 /TAXON_ID=311385 /ORGANISM="Pseudokeronopsis sp., Strain OXSARD2" /LENGTH=34 /DNA_ID= /DNA_START= /DNA_END= /DNA_ORIENTATION=
MTDEQFKLMANMEMTPGIPEGEEKMESQVKTSEN